MKWSIHGWLEGGHWKDGECEGNGGKENYKLNQKTATTAKRAWAVLSYFSSLKQTS